MAVQDWDATFEGTPDGDTALPSSIDDRIRELKETIRSLNQKEHTHEFTDVPVEQGFHVAGSAVVFEDASAPSLPADPNNTGRVWVDSSAGSIKAYEGTGWDTIRDQRMGTSDDVTFNSVEAEIASSILMSTGLLSPTTYTSGDVFDTLDTHIPNVGDEVRIFFNLWTQYRPGDFWEHQTIYWNRAKRTSATNITLYGVDFIRSWSNPNTTIPPEAPFTLYSPREENTVFVSGSRSINASFGGYDSKCGVLIVFD